MSKVQHALKTMVDAIETLNPDDGIRYEVEFEPGSAKLCLKTYISEELESEVHFRLDLGLDDNLLARIAGFQADWENKHPPLVRASAACSLHRQAQVISASLLRDAGAEAGLMARRSRVSQNIALAHQELAKLLQLLANHADEEAMAKGIDLDDRYQTGQVQRASMEMLVDETGWKVTKADGAIAKVLSEDVARETDREVVDEICTTMTKDTAQRAYEAYEADSESPLKPTPWDELPLEHQARWQAVALATLQHAALNLEDAEVAEQTEEKMVHWADMTANRALVGPPLCGEPEPVATTRTLEKVTCNICYEIAEARDEDDDS
jgi:hypothetical protein